jgi:hypothetical protein
LTAAQEDATAPLIEGGLSDREVVDTVGAMFGVARNGLGPTTAMLEELQFAPFPTSVPVQLAMGDFDAQTGRGPDRQESFVFTGIDPKTGNVTLLNAQKQVLVMHAYEMIARLVSTPHHSRVESRSRTEAAMTAEIKRSGAVVAALWFGPQESSGIYMMGGHVVTVTKMGEKLVHFTNPHGDEETITKEDFFKRLRVAVTRD